MTSGEKSQDEQVRECLESLGISLLSEWDVLFFLHRHGVSIARDEELARLLGYGVKVVTEGLDRLEAHGLVARSGRLEKAQLYQVSVSIYTERNTCFQQLVTVAMSRKGRLYLAEQLKAAAQSETERRDKSDQEEGAKWTKGT